jgi:apolipoprotein N-acyltransferase
MPFAKIIVVVLLLLIILSLGAGLFSLVRERGESTRTAKFLTLRIALSIVTFLFIALAFYMGWLQPHGLLPPRV